MAVSEYLKKLVERMPRRLLEMMGGRGLPPKTKREFT
jgi:hypothetical protein